MPTRLTSSFALPPPDDPLRPSYTTRREDHQFAKQYANLYWLRLVVLRKRVLERARRKWEVAGQLQATSRVSLSHRHSVFDRVERLAPTEPLGADEGLWTRTIRRRDSDPASAVLERTNSPAGTVNTDRGTDWQARRSFAGVKTPPRHVKRLLEVENGKLCYVVGTVYVDMPLKPNVLEDLARDHHITAPTPRKKYHSPSDEIMLEDESGRVRLVGKKVDDAEGVFVTGTIMAALGAETASGDFEVIEYCFAGLPPQPALAPTTPEGEWVAIASGLEMGSASDAADVRTELLVEYLLGEAGDDEDQEEAVKVSRLILAGNSLARPDIGASASEEPKKIKYGYDSSLYTAKPTEALDAFLSELAPSLPIELMPGETDPTEPTLPQQPLHHALLPNAALYEGFTGRTNPVWSDIGGASFFGTSGQTVDDIFKYLEGDDRLGVAIQTLEWSHIAPTCPDTLWCFPFTDRDPFILHQTPHVYFVGNQPEFETRLVEAKPAAESADQTVKRVRVVLVPKFSETGEVVLVNTATLEVRRRRFALGE